MLPRDLLLAISESDTHLFESDLVKRAGDFQSLCLLIFSQAGARVLVELPNLFPAVKTALLENNLRLLDLILGSTKDRTPFFRSRFATDGSRIRVLGLSLACDRQTRRYQ